MLSDWNLIKVQTKTQFDIRIFEKNKPIPDNAEIIDMNAIILDMYKGMETQKAIGEKYGVSVAILHKIWQIR